MKMIEFKNIANSLYGNINEDLQYHEELKEILEKMAKEELYLWEVQASCVDKPIKEAAMNFIKLNTGWIFKIFDVVGETFRTIDGYLIALCTDDVVQEQRYRLLLSLQYVELGIKKKHGFIYWMPKSKVHKVIQVSTLTEKELDEELAKYHGIQLPLGEKE